MSKDKKRIPIDFTPQLMEQLHKYAKISACDLLNGGEGSQAALQIAENAVSTLCYRWLIKPPTATTRTDGFYFISVKNAVINEINAELNTIKRRMYNDNYGIQLDEPYEGMKLELIDETTEDGYKEKLISDNDDVESKLGIIVKALEESEYIEEIDYEIFRRRYMDGETLTKIAEELGYSTSHIYVRHRRIKNVINHLATTNGF